MNRAIASFVIGVLMASIALGNAAADTIKIVAFGDSGTQGSGRAHRSGQTGGVPRTEAWPAKLESALRAKGWDVSVANQGTAGQTARDAVSYVDMRVPTGTNLTIVWYGGNDIWAGRSQADIAASLSEIVAKVRAKGSIVVLVTCSGDPASSAVRQSADASVCWTQGMRTPIPGGPLPQYDSGDGEHFNAAGNDAIVARAVPDIERLLMQHGFRPRQ
jgi:acyl-CoA thioesterase-1